MKTAINNQILEIIPDDGEELTICRQTIYPDRVVVFNTIEKDVLQEIHFDKTTGDIMDREKRKQALPKFEYLFDESGIKAYVEHRFLDELDFKDYKPKGIDIETTTVRLVRANMEDRLYLHSHPINKSSSDYRESAKYCVETLLHTEAAQAGYKTFLKETYSKLSTKEKANYHYGQIYFADRMQGGYPSGYSNPAASWFSSWFIETYGPYDDDVFATLRSIAALFNIDTRYLSEMVKYPTRSQKWKAYARELSLLEESAG